jgi:lipopolysaccharide biosynthesis glycosyltransferase
MASPINIALAFDDNFWAPAYTVMRSICLSTKRKPDLVFHLLHMPLSGEHRHDLDGITREFGARLVYVPLAQSDLFDFVTSGLPASAQWPKVVYARLLLADLLPIEIERVLYLDCDMLVRRPIEQLYEMDLEGKPLGAVPDALSPFLMGRRDMRQNKDIFDLSDPYFNSGMLLADLVQWRRINVKAEVAAIAAKDWLPRLYYDQDVLNLVFRGRFLSLEWRWNTIDAQAAHEGLDPAILHYTRRAKPWGVLSGILHSSAYARWYRHVMTNDLFYRFARHRWASWWKKILRISR